MKWYKSEYWISDDNKDTDINAVYQYLSKESYWSKGIPHDTLIRSLDNSLCFNLFSEQRQVGFSRIVSDYATFAYLGDVYVLNDFKGRGLGKWLMDCISDHPSLQKLRRWILATSDAHGLYQQYQFRPLTKPEIFMERYDSTVYTAPTSPTNEEL